jgi:hypothetical protein
MKKSKKRSRGSSTWGSTGPEAKPKEHKRKKSKNQRSKSRGGSKVVKIPTMDVKRSSMGGPSVLENSFGSLNQSL